MPHIPLSRRVRRTTLHSRTIAVTLPIQKVGRVVLTLARPHRRSRRRVVQHRRVIDANQNTGLLTGISTGELDRRRGTPRSTTRNLQLRTANIELRTTLLPGPMKANALRTEKILPSFEIIRQRKREVRNPRAAIVKGSPLRTLRLGDTRRRQRVHLEPVTVSLVLLCGSGCFAHVDLLGPWVSEVVAEDEADFVAGGDLVCLCGAHDVCVNAADVADDVVRGHIGDGAVAVLGAADVFVVFCFFAVDDEGGVVPVGEGLGEDGEEGRDGNE